MHVLCILFFRGFEAPWRLVIRLWRGGGTMCRLKFKARIMLRITMTLTHTHTNIYSTKQYSEPLAHTPTASHRSHTYACLKSTGIWMDNIRRGIFRPVFSFSRRLHQNVLHIRKHYMWKDTRRAQDWIDAVIYDFSMWNRRKKKKMKAKSLFARCRKINSRWIILLVACSSGVARSECCVCVWLLNFMFHTFSALALFKMLQEVLLIKYTHTRTRKPWHLTNYVKN